MWHQEGMELAVFCKRVIIAVIGHVIDVAKVVVMLAVRAVHAIIVVKIAHAAVIDQNSKEDIHFYFQ